MKESKVEVSGISRIKLMKVKRTINNLPNKVIENTYWVYSQGDEVHLTAISRKMELKIIGNINAIGQNGNKKNNVKGEVY